MAVVAVACKHLNRVDGMTIRLYIAGPMTGIPFFNRHAFKLAAEKLLNLGYDVISPVDRLGGDIAEIERTSVDGDASVLTIDQQIAIVRQNTEDVISADGLAVLDGWWQSKGTRHEITLANRLGKPVRAIETWYWFSGDQKRLSTVPMPNDPVVIPGYWPKLDPVNDDEIDYMGGPDGR